MYRCKNVKIANPVWMLWLTLILVAPVHAEESVRQLFFSEPSLGYHLTLTRVNEKGEIHEFRIPVLDWSHEIRTTSPPNSASALMAGKRQHKPLRVIKAVNEDSEPLFEALIQGTVFDLAVLEIYGHGEQSGSPARVITLENVIITALSSKSSGSELGPVDEIELSYQKIAWSFSNGAVQQDVW